MIKLLLPCLLLSTSIAAEVEVSASKHQQTDSVSSFEGEGDIELTRIEKEQAKAWGLTESDWRKYKKIMQGPRGIWSPNLDPITALGVMEESESERTRYAETWIRVEAKRVELELAFERARMAAGRRYFGDMKAVDDHDLKQRLLEQKQQKTKRIAFFVEHDCIETCLEKIAELRNSMGTTTQLDVYFDQSKTTSDQIASWAIKMGISQEEVKARKITLNYDDLNRAQEYKVDKARLPQIRVVDVKTNTVSAPFD